MSGARWDILIASVYARTPQLSELLKRLSVQLWPYDGQVRVLVARDDCELPVGRKRTLLVEASDADYISFVDDDDSVSTDYVEEVASALAQDPDYVGFRVAYSVDGERQKDAHHSLRYGCWLEDADGYYRGVSHLNPLRREAAVAALPFQDGFGEDRDWADRVQASGLLRREVFIDAALYHYRYSSGGSLFAGGVRSLGRDPGLREFEHVRVLPAVLGLPQNVPANG